MTDLGSLLRENTMNHPDAIQRRLDYKRKIEADNRDRVGTFFDQTFKNLEYEILSGYTYTCNIPDELRAIGLRLVRMSPDDGRNDLYEDEWEKFKARCLFFGIVATAHSEGSPRFTFGPGPEVIRFSPV